MKSLRVALIVFLLSGTAVFIDIGSSHADAPQNQARILNIEGEVRYKMPSSMEWKDAKKDDSLIQGTEILTGANAACEIVIGQGNQSEVKLQSDSTATLTSLDPVKIDLKSGNILSLVRHLKPGSTFQVSTPTAVAVARGTGWKQGKNSLKAFEGTVHLNGSNGQEIDIPAGKGVTIDDNGHFGELFDLSNEDLNEWKDFQNSISGNTAGFGGDFHESEGSEATVSLGDLQNTRSGTTEDKKTDKHLQDMLNKKDNPEPNPSPSPSGD